MRGLILAALLATLAAASAHAQFNADSLLARGAERYDDAQFNAAAATYDSLLQHGYRLPEVYFNLGNAYFRAGDIGNAIWAFRAAQLRAPRDPDISANLAVARLAARDRIESVPPGFWNQMWHAVSTTLTFQEGAWLVTGSWCLLWLLIAAWLFVRRVRRWLGTSIRLVALVWAAAALVFVARYLEVHNTTHAVVIAPEVQAKSGPGAEFDDVFVGHAGLESKIRGHQNGYLLMELANGRVGWAPEADLRVVPF